MFCHVAELLNEMWRCQVSQLDEMNRFRGIELCNIDVSVTRVWSQGKTKRLRCNLCQEKQNVCRTVKASARCHV